MVTNKLLLAFKNKPKFLENIVMNANPSLLSILMYIKSQIKDSGYADVDTLEKNKEMYVQSMKINKNVKVDDGIIVQYGGGSMMKPGSYDRYTPFRNNPDADFLVIAWPLGLVQASCNPFKKERALKGVNLGEIKDEVLNKWKSQLQNKDIPLSTIKWISESGKSFNEESVGFTFKDFNALYGKEFKRMDDGEKILNDIDVVMKKPFSELTQNEMKMLDSISVNAWDLIKSNSGGHKCITNISGLSYLGRSKRPPEGKYKYNSESDDSPYVKFTKMIQNEFARILKEKIKETNKVNENYNLIRKKDLIPSQINYKAINNMLIKEQKISLPIKIGTTWQSPKRDADLLHSFERRKSDKQGAYIGTQIERELKKVYAAGINPDVVNFTLSVNSKAYSVTWSATIVESKDGKAYVGFSTRGSAGGGSDRRALSQVGPLKQQLTKNGAQDITQVLDFTNPTGIPIRQYFFKYTIPNKYPPFTTKGNYTRGLTDLSYVSNKDNSNINANTNVNANANVNTNDNTNTNVNTNTNTKPLENDFFGINAALNRFKEKLSGKQTNTTSVDTTSGNTTSVDTTSGNTTNIDTTSSNTKNIGGPSNFEKITKIVINKLEGGYWNGSTTKNEKTTKMGICKNHPKGSMGASTETMFGLDRYNGNIESTPEGKEFFRIIDEEKKKLGMDGFCQKWKWLYKGGDKEEILKDLVVKNRKASFDRNMSKYVNAETKQKVESIPGLTLHMSYATWNGPGFFKKFAKSLESKIKTGASDKELIDLAISDRAKTGLANKSKTEAVIRSA
jgi:hypothetical protein